MNLRLVLDPDLTPTLREQLVALWVDVTNARGAVGFVAPVIASDVRVTADKTFAGIVDGPDRLLVGYDGERDEVLMWLDVGRPAAERQAD